MLDLGPRVLEHRAHLHLEASALGKCTTKTGYIMERPVAEFGHLAPSLVRGMLELDLEMRLDELSNAVDFIREVRDDAHTDEIGQRPGSV